MTDAKKPTGELVYCEDTLTPQEWRGVRRVDVWEDYHNRAALVAKIDRILLRASTARMAKMIMESKRDEDGIELTLD